MKRAGDTGTVVTHTTGTSMVAEKCAAAIHSGTTTAVYSDDWQAAGAQDNASLAGQIVGFCVGGKQTSTYSYGNATWVALGISADAKTTGDCDTVMAAQALL